MEVAILLLLTVPFTTAVPISHTQRSVSVASDDTTQGSGVESAQDRQTMHTLKIIPFLPDDNQPIRDELKHSIAAKLRPRRALNADASWGHVSSTTWPTHSTTSAKKMAKMSRRQPMTLKDMADSCYRNYFIT
ncbi:hypothetical protein WMY93_010960 [Mugilogobius chulae]|uniref:Melanin-concentrating hormone n=1 Tax=Mugilogobius chulae TaxID=88201 RepID=A0AAW0PKD6_9GOBI